MTRFFLCLCFLYSFLASAQEIDAFTHFPDSGKHQLRFSNFGDHTHFSALSYAYQRLDSIGIIGQIGVSAPLGIWDINVELGHRLLWNQLGLETWSTLGFRKTKAIASTGLFFQFQGKIPIGKSILYLLHQQNLKPIKNTLEFLGKTPNGLGWVLPGKKLAIHNFLQYSEQKLILHFGVQVPIWNKGYLDLKISSRQELSITLGIKGKNQFHFQRYAAKNNMDALRISGIF
ncbi:MAG: hypothetical protein ACJAY8_001325 [Sphingobacteriales bacterium]|jgi:hypothetical protein